QPPLGTRHPPNPLPPGRHSESDLARLAALASVADETPEGKSIVKLAQESGGVVATAVSGAQFVAFSAQTRMSGVDLPGGRRVRKGAVGAAVSFVRAQKRRVPGA